LVGGIIVPGVGGDGEGLAVKASLAMYAASGNDGDELSPDPPCPVQEVKVTQTVVAIYDAAFSVLR